MPPAAAAQKPSDDPVFGASFYAPYEAAVLAALELLCRARSAHEGDVIALHFRLKTPASIRGKLQKKGLPASAPAAAGSLHDVAGLRAVLASEQAVYRFARTLLTSGVLSLDAVHDYIARPKKSGYRSLHLLVRVPVAWDGCTMMVPAEIQLRTQAMDAWACMEHRLIYKPVRE